MVKSFTNVILLLFGVIHSYLKCDSGTGKKKKNAWIDIVTWIVTFNINLWSISKMETLLHVELHRKKIVTFVIRLGYLKWST